MDPDTALGSIMQEMIIDLKAAQEDLERSDERRLATCFPSAAPASGFGPAALSASGSPAIRCPATGLYEAPETALYVEPTLDTTRACRARLTLFTQLTRVLRFSLTHVLDHTSSLAIWAIRPTP